MNLEIEQALLAFRYGEITDLAVCDVVEHLVGSGAISDEEAVQAYLMGVDIALDEISRIDRRITEQMHEKFPWVAVPERTIH